MTNSQKLQNDQFFKRMIQFSKNDGYYVWPNENEVFRISDGVMSGSKSAIQKMKNITTKNFHKCLVEQK